MPIAVELVTLAPETRATRLNPTPPHPDPKPDLPVADTPVPKPEAKPEPPRPMPPPSAASPPPQPEPVPQPQPAKTVEAPPPPPPPKPPEPKPEPPPPPKPPEPKPEPPKPAERVEAAKPRTKPAPPQQLAHNEPRPEQKKQDAAAFDALLKNLTREPTAPSPEGPPQRQRYAAAATVSAQPRAPLGAKLTTAEEDLIRQHIYKCWNIPIGARSSRDLVAEIRAVVGPDGTVELATISDQARVAADPFFRAFAESARRALLNPACRKLPVPPEKYAIWKDLVLNFNPKDVL
jgi:hypothetical protein